MARYASDEMVQLPADVGGSLNFCLMRVKSALDKEQEIGEVDKLIQNCGTPPPPCPT